MIYIPIHSIILYTYIDNNIVQIITNILNKVKTYIDSDKSANNKSEVENKSKKKRVKIRYNKHGFPTYSPRNAKDSELNKRR